MELILLAPLWVQLLLAFVLGSAIGSFLNVVIHRLPRILDHNWRQECTAYLELDKSPAASEQSNPPSLLWPASHCPKCHNKIRAWHNIPLLGYLMLGGKCRDCDASISPRYPLVELITALASVAVIYSLGATPQGLFALFFTWALIALTGIDFDEHLLPDSITLPLLWAGLIVNSQGLFTDLHTALFGAVAGYLVLWLVYWVFKLVTGKEGMGFGDFKLLAALGAWLGWPWLASIILLSSLTGLFFAICFMLFSGNKKSAPVAFGPYLAMAGWLCMVAGPLVTQLIPV